MLLNLYIWIILQTTAAYGYGDKTVQEKAVDEMLSKAMINARHTIEELKRNHELLPPQGINVMEHIQMPFRIWPIHTSVEPNVQKLAHAALISIVATKK
ncbi:hypothetical protein LOAG_13786 [Loa loa]|uniref:Uncharacterized protein n=1 Tax=Loa loa TaxID=7209 RepID=A0A1S0TJE6_LOALO|nr:hypothetical protein LOAG_13786 [Loa loa]EFO14731.1 hypothetical protein LOAG_13786 [Loa loa]